MTQNNADMEEGTLEIGMGMLCSIFKLLCNFIYCIKGPIIVVVVL